MSTFYRSVFCFVFWERDVWMGGGGGGGLKAKTVLHSKDIFIFNSWHHPPKKIPDFFLPHISKKEFFKKFLLESPLPTQGIFSFFLNSNGVTHMTLARKVVRVLNPPPPKKKLQIDNGSFVRWVFVIRGYH